MLSTNDQKTCFKIFEVTDSINKMYKILFLDEIGDDYLSQEKRIEAIDELRRLIELEEELYDELEVTIEKASDIYEAVDDRYTEEVLSCSSNIDTAFNCHNFSALSKERIKNRVYIRAMEGDSSLKQIVELIAPNAIIMRRLGEAITGDIERAFLYFNEKDINSTSGRNRLSKVKYQLIFISENAERHFLDNKDTDYLYFSYPLIADYYKVPQEVMLNQVISIGSDFARRALNTLICSNDEIEDDLLTNKDDRKMFHSYLKASIAPILNTPSYDGQIEGLETELQELDEVSMGAVSKSIDSIFDTLKSLDKEKVKCKYITLKN